MTGIARSVGFVALALCALLTLGPLAPAALAGPKAHKLVDRWKDPDFERREFRKLIIVGITDDREVRRNFENKFVSHLRGRDIQGITSHSAFVERRSVVARGAKGPSNAARAATAAPASLPERRSSRLLLSRYPGAWKRTCPAPIRTPALIQSS